MVKSNNFLTKLCYTVIIDLQKMPLRISCKEIPLCNYPTTWYNCVYMTFSLMRQNYEDSDHH